VTSAYPAVAGSVRAATAATASRADLALAYAAAQVGKPYVFGAAGPGSFDCSGLTMRAWQAAGLDLLQHNTILQWAETSKRAYSQAQPGDLVFYGTPPIPHHVALYAGGGMQYSAPTEGEDVQLQQCYGGDQIMQVGIMPGAGAATTAQPASSSASSAAKTGVSIPGPGAVFSGLNSLMPWSWASDLSNAQSGLAKLLIGWSLKLAFIGGGITLAILGAYDTVPKGGGGVPGGGQLPPIIPV
jgi:hypothetical protein